MATPKKALIFYSDRPNTGNTNYFLNSLCSQGCSGQISLEDLRHQERTHLMDLIQLWGVYGCKNEEEMKKRLGERFGKMSFGILSLSSESIALAKSLGFAFTGLAQDTPKALSLQIKQVLESAAPSVHCLFVDLSKKEDAWEDVDQCVSDLIDSAPDYLKCLVSRHTVATTLNIEPQWWSTIVPEQSCTKKGGEKVAIDPRQVYSSS
ncbi:hypothetical protein BDF14DRAFT_563580 [Spinellus fusiger]|nr:hypothetical protein BDF14DRAFT_563580 [Spinellus fusiger]